MGQIKAIITDFDGTLVDTFIANFNAYLETFKHFGYKLTKEQYRKCYGLRFDGFCDEMNIKEEDRKPMKEYKKEVYPKYFKYIELNNALLYFIRYMKAIGIKTCIASTASKENLYNVIEFFKIKNNFDLILTGEDVKFGKPDPYVYNEALIRLNIDSDEALVFEDSNVGCESANKAGINYIKITNGNSL